MSEENKYTFENEEYRKTYWHTCSHVLAQAVKRLYPEVKLAIGPSIDDGFYYDLDAPFAFTQEDLTQIEAEMRKICKEKLKLERFELPREEALKFMEERGEPYKVELINDLPADAHISFISRASSPICAPAPIWIPPAASRGQRHQADGLQRRLLEGRQRQPPDPPAHLRRGLPQEGGTGRLPEGAGGGSEAGSQQAGP